MTLLLFKELFISMETLLKIWSLIADFLLSLSSETFHLACFEVFMCINSVESLLLVTLIIPVYIQNNIMQGASLYRVYVRVTHPRARARGSPTRTENKHKHQYFVPVGHPRAHELYTNLLFGKLQS